MLTERRERFDLSSKERLSLKELLSSKEYLSSKGILSSKEHFRSKERCWMDQFFDAWESSLAHVGQLGPVRLTVFCWEELMGLCAC